MKKLMSIALLVFFTGGVVLADAPKEVKEKFRKDYPDAMNIVWKDEKGDLYKVIYTDAKCTMHWCMTRTQMC